MAKKDINFNTYVKRDLSKTTVDWGTVATKLTTDLLKVRKERETKRAEIETNTDEVTTKLNTMEDYTSQSLQNLALGMSGDSAEFLRTQNELFKRGLITQTEFAQAKQRVLGDWQQFGNISKRWESDYVEMVTRAENKDASTVEMWLNEQNAEFGNLKGVRGMVNPDSGALSLIRPNEDGSISNDPSRHVSLNVLQNRFNSRINNVAKDGAIDKQLEGSVDRLGELIIATIEAKSGDIFSVEGQKQALENKDIQRYLDDSVSSLTSNFNTTLSILGDIGTGYEPTLDPKVAAKDPKRMLLAYNENGIAVPVEDAPNWAKYNDEGELIGGQMFEANKILKNRMIAMLDNKEAYKAGDRELTEYQKRRLAQYDNEIALQKKQLNEIQDEDNAAMKYVEPRWNRDPSELKIMGGRKATDYLNEEIGKYITSAFDDDEQVPLVFSNIIQSVMDKNMFTDLEAGKYKGQKPFNIDYLDSGSDRLVLTMGDKKIVYPPLRGSLKEKDYERKSLNENVKMCRTKDNGDATKYNVKSNFECNEWTKEEFLQIYNEGYYGVDTDGDGLMDTFKQGLKNYEKKGRGANHDNYDTSAEMLDFVKRNLINPVSNNLMRLQNKSFKKTLPGTD